MGIGKSSFLKAQLSFVVTELIYSVTLVTTRGYALWLFFWHIYNKDILGGPFFIPPERSSHQTKPLAVSTTLGTSTIV